VQLPVLPEDGNSIVKYNEAWGQFRPLIFNQLTMLWQERQTAEQKALKKKDKQAWQLIFDKNGHKAAVNMPLSAIFENSFDAVTAYLPLLFVTPHVALNELPNIPNYFDYVIFDEANKFPVEMATAIAPLGKKMVIMGSNDSYGNETSLLQYALENGVPSALITNRYEPPSPITGLVAGDAHYLDRRINYQVDNVEGRFHELEGTNDTEAQHILRLLNQIKHTPQRVLPSVGIVTFTVEQRDLIANYLLKLKQQNALGSEKIHQLERNGMGVFHVDELFGQYFDLIIVSCTYGAVNLKGEMTKKMVFLNTPAGVGHLRMLINKPVDGFHIVHSLPEDYLQQIEAKKWEEGTWYLAHFIRLAEAMKNGNQPQIMISNEALGKRQGVVHPPSIFANEVVRALEPYLDIKRITTNVGTESIYIPLFVKPSHEDGKPVVLVPDGHLSVTAFTSPPWEQDQVKTIEKSGFGYLPIWSVNWLKNPGVEARLLASKVIKLDANPAGSVAGEDAELQGLEEKLRE
jgi:hypothetical protein